MENTNTASNQNLFHTQVLADALTSSQIPSAHQQILQDWSKNIISLNEQDHSAQCAAFFKNILIDILGYQSEAADAYTLKDMTAQDNYFDAALGQFDKETSQITTLLKLRGPSYSNLDAPDSLQQMPIKSARQQGKTLQGQFFLMSNLDEVRLYSLVHQRTVYERFSLTKMANDVDEYQRFYLLLNAENMLSGKTLQLLNDSIAAGLNDKLTKNHPTIKDIYGPLRKGLPIHVDNAFVIDIRTYKTIMQEDSKSQEILKPFFPGDTIKKWYSDIDPYFMIYTPKGQVDIEKYPAIKKHLEQFKDELEKRAGDMKWYEFEYEEDLKHRENEVRIGIGNSQFEPGVIMGTHGAQYGEFSYYIPNADFFLFGLLNSAPFSKLIKLSSKKLDNGMYEIDTNVIESLPVPNAEGLVRAKMGRFSTFCMEKMLERREAVRYFQGSTAFNLSPNKLNAKLSNRLINWFTLDFPEFRNEIIATFGADIPEDSLQLWTDYFHQEKASILNRDMELQYATNEVDSITYEIFDLDSDEIALIAEK